MFSRIGILGGLSYRSTVYYYELLNLLYLSEFKNYPEVFINSLNLNKFNDYLHNGQTSRVFNYLKTGLEELVNSGCEVLLISSNTPHFLVPRLSAGISVPIISIVDSVKESLRQKPIRRVLLLGTKFTMESDYYNKALSELPGLTLTVPDEPDLENIDNKIFTELAKGMLLKETGDYLLSLIERYRDKDNIEGVILGCTELPLILPEFIPGLEIFNTSRIHCETVIEFIKSTK